MDFEDRNEHLQARNGICRLEWIAAAMEAARQHRQTHPARKNPLPVRNRQLAAVERNGDRS